MTDPTHDLLTRYAEREQWTQSLPFAAGLQDRGWACLVAGGGLLILNPKPSGTIARMQRPRVIDVPQLELICGRTPIERLLVEPGPAGVIVDRGGRRHPWRYDPQSPSFPVLEAIGWEPTRAPIAHTKTVVVDLAPDLDQVTRRFATAARRNTKAALARTDVVYRDIAFDEASDEELDRLRALHQAFAEHHPNLANEWRIWASVATHFGPRGRYVLAYHEAQLIGAIFLLIHDRVASYLAAMSRTPAHTLRVPTGLVVTAMQTAQRHGCDLFDFIGVYDERVPRSNPAWKGFSQFKQRFGGHEVYLPMGFEVPLPET